MPLSQFLRSAKQTALAKIRRLLCGMAGGLQDVSEPQTGLATMRQSQPPTAARKVTERRRGFFSVGAKVFVTGTRRHLDEVRMDAETRGRVSVEPSCLFEAAKRASS